MTFLSLFMMRVEFGENRVTTRLTQSVSVADCYFIVNVLDLPFASPIRDRGDHFKVVELKNLAKTRKH